MGFQKAVKSKSKLRCALFGPSGSGKTYSALSIAKGIGGKVAVIDSERGSASKYADKFEFDVVDLEKKSIDEYVQFISEAGTAGYSVLIIDSLTHAWQDLLEEVEKLANAKYRGNTWSAWSEGTPKQRALVNAILSCPCHIMATMRSKTEWQTTQDDRGKSRPVRVGLAPEQGKGIEYEFDMLLELSTDHIANVIKDRTGMFQDKLLTKPGVDFGKELVDWLNTGVDERIMLQKKLEAMPEVIEVKATLAKYAGSLEQNIKDFAEAEVKKDHTPEWFSRLNMKILNSIPGYTSVNEDNTEEVA
jgi:predicted house-cleaning noncanonical NTP pyrophosphatase (MazG superfamily)